MWSPGMPELGTSGIAHYNEDSAPRALFVSLGREPFWNVIIAQKNYFEQKSLTLESGYAIDAHRYDQVSHAAGDYAPVS